MKIRLGLLISGVGLWLLSPDASSNILAAPASQTPLLKVPVPQLEKNDTVKGSSYEELDEVVVTAEKPVIKTDGAKLTYNVDEDPGAASTNALDLLKKVPQVSVDGDGNIRLNGSDNYKLQLNGLDNPMLKQYSGQILENMPGNMIVRIEVITEPGAKEDAEGTAGIINIITERTRQKDGYNGTASLKIDNRNLSPSLSATYKKDKVTLGANVSYSWGFTPQKTEQEMTTTYLDAANPGYLKTRMGQEMKFQFVNGGLNMSWEPNPRNLFTLGGDFLYLDADVNSLTGSTGRFNPSNSLLWSFGQKGWGSMKIINLSANASYRHNFALEGQNYLVLSYLFNFGKNYLEIIRNYDELVDYDPGLTYQDEDNRSFNRGHTVQLDYANDFHSEHHLMEVGAKGIFRHNTALSYYEYGLDAQPLANIPLISTNILQPQDIYAAYASYTGNFDKFGVTGGLRYEHTLMGITNRLDEKENFRNRLNDLVPNVALTWNFTNSSNLRLAYQMRISRPSIEQVNPFQLSFSPYEVREGNPDLTSERSHIVSIKYSGFGRVIGGSIGLEYRLADNAISSFTYLRESEGYNTIVTSFANIGKKQDVGLNGFLSWTIIPKMTLMLNGRLAYNKLSAPAEGFSNHGWSGNIGGAWNYTVADVYRLSAYGMWNSRTLNVQGYSSGFYYYGLSVARDFLSDKSLSLSLSANNFLQKKMTFKGQTVTPSVIYDNVARTLTAWSIGISVTWKFGSLNAKVKDTGVEIKNDDINSSSNKGQGGL